MTSKPKQATVNLFLQIKDMESYFVVYFQHNNQYKGIPRYPSPLGAPPLLVWGCYSKKFNRDLHAIYFNINTWVIMIWHQNHEEKNSGNENNLAKNGFHKYFIKNYEIFQLSIWNTADMCINIYKLRWKDCGIKRGEIFVADFADFVAGNTKPLDYQGVLRV